MSKVQLRRTQGTPADWHKQYGPQALDESRCARDFDTLLDSRLKNFNLSTIVVQAHMPESQSITYLKIDLF